MGGELAEQAQRQKEREAALRNQLQRIRHCLGHCLDTVLEGECDRSILLASLLCWTLSHKHALRERHAADVEHLASELAQARNAMSAVEAACGGDAIEFVRVALLKFEYLGMTTGDLEETLERSTQRRETLRLLHEDLIGHEGRARDRIEGIKRDCELRLDTLAEDAAQRRERDALAMLRSRERCFAMAERRSAELEARSAVEKKTLEDHAHGRHSAQTSEQRDDGSRLQKDRYVGVA